MSADTRLVHIEEKIARLEQFLGELDGVVREMNDRMDGYKTQLAKLRETVESQSAAGGGDSDDDDGGGHRDQQFEDDRPPHW